MKKTITVFSDDPDTPQLTLTMSGELWVDVAPDPYRLAFGDVRKSARATKPLSLAITEPDEVSIVSVTVDDDRFVVEELPDSGDAQKKYEVVFKGADAFGRIRASVRIAYTGADGKKETSVPVYGQVVSDLRYPNRVFVQQKDGAFPPRKVAFTSRSGKAVRILSARDPEGRLKAKMLPLREGTAELEISVASSVTANAQGRLEVKTTDREEPKISIPYSIMIPRARPTGSAQGAPWSSRSRGRAPRR